jgi:Cu-Zn family superoxide dismutase
MVKSLGSGTPAAILIAVAAAALSACSPNEPIATQPGTVPPVWTGSPAPAGMAGEHGGMEHGSMDHGEMKPGEMEPGEMEPGEMKPGAMGAGAMGAAAATADTLTAEINSASGSQVAAATIEFKDNDGFATITVQTVAPGLLSPGMHGIHIHAVGKCEVNSVGPSGGAPGDFLSAGGHLQAGGSAAHPGHGGDLSSLQVRGDGTAMLVTTSNAFDRADLLDGGGTAFIIHESADNFANIPADRYQQIDGGATGPDAVTLATGDSGKRVACGVISAG